MNLGDAKTFLRIMLSDQSESIWSDAELATVLVRSNGRVWRTIVSSAPRDFVETFEVTVPASTEELDLGVAVTDHDGGSVTIPELLTVEYARWKDSGDSTQSSVTLHVRNLESGFDRILGSNHFEDLPKFTQGERVISFFRGTRKLLFFPRPGSQKLMYLYGVRAIPSTTPSLDSHDLLDGRLEALSEAVVFDAAYLLTFKDRSTREEFLAERERMLAAYIDTVHSQRLVD